MSEGSECFERERKIKITDKILKVLDKAEPRPNAFECIEILKTLELAFKQNIAEKKKKLGLK